MWQARSHAGTFVLEAMVGLADTPVALAWLPMLPAIGLAVGFFGRCDQTDMYRHSHWNGTTYSHMRCGTLE